VILYLLKRALHPILWSMLMAIEDVKDQLAEVKSDVQRALVALAAVREENAALHAAIVALQEQIAAGTPATDEDLEELLVGLDAIEEAIEAVIPEETEEVPPPVEEPPVEPAA
jgi:chromosome segregation ATPase